MADNSGRVADSPQLEKPEVTQTEFTGDHHHHGRSKKDEMDRVDAMALGGGVTKASLAHLDESKILRKVMSQPVRRDGVAPADYTRGRWTCAFSPCWPSYISCPSWIVAIVC